MSRGFEGEPIEGRSDPHNSASDVLMTRIRPQKTQAFLIVAAYAVLVLGTQAVEARCCIKHHHGKDVPGSGCGFVSLEQADCQPAPDGLHQERGHVRFPVDHIQLRTLGCCAGHVHVFSDPNHANWAVPARYSSSSRPSRSALCTTLMAGNDSTVWYNALLSYDGLADITAITSLKTTVLLI